MGLVLPFHRVACANNLKQEDEEEESREIGDGCCTLLFSIVLGLCLLRRGRQAEVPLDRKWCGETFAVPRDVVGAATMGVFVSDIIFSQRQLEKVY